jgi:branched-chain amino acid transport system ATP-binding protein
MGRPRLLLLDEPTLGLAPLVVDALLQNLRRLASDGIAIVLAEQRAAIALRIARRAAVLVRGSIVRQATTAELLADPTLAELATGV